MDKRKELILNTIIKEFIKTGNPVGSSVLVEKYKLKVSPATVRNEMAALEEDGLIVQPHTSAGRIPTEQAYRLYTEKICGKKLSPDEMAALSANFSGNGEEDFKNAAKTIAQLSKNAVFWAFHKHNLYYTGLSNSFQQPEFRELDLVYDMSSVIDRFDEIMDEVFDCIKPGRHIMLGRENPFGNFCGAVLAKYRLEDNTGMVGILGPLRMDYEKNIAIIDYVSGMLSREKNLVA